MEQPRATAYVVRYDPTTERTVRFRRGIFALSVTMLLLSLCIIFLGSLTFGIGIRDIGVDGTPIWGGVYMIVTAAIGIAAAKRKSTCLLISFLVLAIISTLISGAMMGMSITWSAVSGSRYGYYHYRNEERWAKGIDRQMASTVLQAIVAFMALVNVVLAIVAASLTCANLCSCCCPKNRPVGQMIELRGQIDQQPPGYDDVTALPEKQIPV